MDRRSVLKSMAASAMLAALGVHAAEEVGATIIRVNIPGPNMLPYLPIELIPRLGIDRALGAQLAIRYMPSGVLALDDVVAGNGHFAGVGFSVLPNFVAKGKSVAAVATLSSGVPPYSILIRPDLAKSVREVRDLKGRSIGIPLGSLTSKTYLQTVMELWLSSHGVSGKDVRWVQTNQNLDGMYGSLASGVVDAVFCEEPLAGTLVRKKVGRRLASLTDRKGPGRATWANHLRAVLAAPREQLDNHPRRAELMVGMLQRSLKWIHSNKPADIVARLGIQDAELASDLVDPIKQMPNLYSPDGRFKDSELEATRAFLVASGSPLPAGMDIRGLIADQWVKR
jgi:NitT/TauT family transport system substrate-binding protein